MKFTESLKKNEEFQKVYRKGKSMACKYLVMYVIPAEEKETNRIGISVSKKVGNSVVRHRLTRLVRESYRLHEEQFQRGYWIVVIARVAAKNQEFRKIEQALLYLAKKEDLISKES